MRLNFATTLLRIASIVIAATCYCGIGVADDFPARPVHMIVAFAPGGTADFTASITIGITGRGAISDLGRQLFEDAAGIKLQGVPYRGAAPALTDMLAGHLDGLFGDVPTIMAQVKAGKLKALAATSTERSDIFPDVPTFVEQGFADVVGDNWDAVLAPAGTPAPIVSKLNAALIAAVNDPEVRTRLHNAGTTPAPSSPAAFDQYLRAEIARWAKVIRAKGITAQ